MGGKWVTVGLTVTSPLGPPQAPPQAGSSAPLNCWPSQETPAPSPATPSSHRPRRGRSGTTNLQVAKGQPRAPATVPPALMVDPVEDGEAV